MCLCPPPSQNFLFRGFHLHCWCPAQQTGGPANVCMELCVCPDQMKSLEHEQVLSYSQMCNIYIYNTCISGIRIWSDGWLALVVTWNWLMLPISIHAYYSNKLCLYLNCLWLGCALTTNMKVAVFTYFSASSVILRVFKGGKIRWLQMTAFEIIKQRRNWDLKN